jgi:membrane protein required for colicin V production
MTVLDWVLLCTVLGIALGGFWKGAVRLVFGIGGLLAGLWLAVTAGDPVALALVELLPVSVSWIGTVVGPILLFAVGAGVFFIAGWGIDRTLEGLRLGWLNRAAGALVAFVVGTLMIGVLMVMAARSSPSFAAQCRRSVIVSSVFDLVSRSWPDSPMESNGER